MSFAVVQVSTGAIFGTGETVPEAVADAACWVDRHTGADLAVAPICDSAAAIRDAVNSFMIVPASPTLCDTVSRRGGDVRWRIEAGRLVEA